MADWKFEQFNPTDPFIRHRAEHPNRFASPERIEQLSRERFKPWPTVTPKFNQPRNPDAPLPVAHLGFVRNERFRQGNEPVIPGTNRSKQRREAQKAAAAREPKR